MKWNVKDVEMFEQARKYVDTALVPLVPITFDEQMQQMILWNDFMSILSMEVEKMFKGRILLTPIFYYVKGDNRKADSLQIWVKELKRTQFKHVFFLSSDESWERDVRILSGLFLFIPYRSIEHQDKEQVHQLMKQQSQLLIDHFTKIWKGEVDQN